MDKRKKARRGSRGETLVETLVATLIIALTSVLLLSMTLAATRLNSISDAKGKEFRAQLATAEKGAAAVGSSREGQLTIQVTGGATYKYDILYSGTADQLNSYDKKAEVSGP